MSTMSAGIADTFAPGFGNVNIPFESRSGPGMNPDEDDVIITGSHVPLRVQALYCPLSGKRNAPRSEFGVNEGRPKRRRAASLVLDRPGDLDAQDARGNQTSVPKPSALTSTYISTYGAFGRAPGRNPIRLGETGTCPRPSPVERETRPEAEGQPLKQLSNVSPELPKGILKPTVGT